MKDSTKDLEKHPLIDDGDLNCCRPIGWPFGKNGPISASMGLVFGELFSFARHTVTQELMTLGITDGDWSAWYRLFSRNRFDEEQLANCLLKETLAHVPADEPYVVAMDGTSICIAAV